MNYFLRCAASTALVLTVSGTATAADFRALAGSYSNAQDASADGSLVIGAISALSPEPGPYIFSDGGKTPLPILHDAGINDGMSLSADGTVAAGSARYSGTEVGSTGLIWEAWRWTEADGTVGLGDLAGGTTSSFGHNVSADGNTVVGYSNSSNGNEAYRWTAATGMVGLGDLAGGDFLSRAEDVSDDGSVVIGRGTSVFGTEAFRWTEADGMVGLGNLGNADFLSVATGLSADGNIITGYSYNDNSEAEAFIWTAEIGMVGLGDLAGGQFQSFARGISADGSVIVGNGYGDNGLDGFIWTAESGMISMTDYLTGLGVDLQGYRIGRIDGLSDDGSTAVGYAYEPSTSSYVAFSANLSVVPIPAAAWLFGSALAGLGWMRRKQTV